MPEVIFFNVFINIKYLLLIKSPIINNSYKGFLSSKNVQLYKFH